MLPVWLLFFLLPPPPPSFDVSLTCGRDSEKEEHPYDVALKLTVRFTDRQFMRSARISGKWIGEEASTSYFPFIPDQPFRVNILFVLMADSLSRCLWCSWGASRFRLRVFDCSYWTYAFMRWDALFSEGMLLLQPCSSLSWLQLRPIRLQTGSYLAIRSLVSLLWFGCIDTALQRESITASNISDQTSCQHYYQNQLILKYKQRWICSAAAFSYLLGALLKCLLVLFLLVDQ